ncbi:MAG: acyltransferase domain-containing protein [Candidatus Brocadiia bacterium]
MKLEKVLSALQEMASLEAVRPAWDESMSLLPAGRPSFLTPAEFSSCREWSGFSKSVEPALEDAARRIAEDPALLRLAWHGYRRAYFGADPSFAGWPKLETALGDAGGVFYLLIALGMMPLMREYHRSIGVPEEVTRETCRQVHSMSVYYARANRGRLGLFARQIGWLRNYIRENLYFRFGRLEYWARPSTAPVLVFRHRRSGAVVALAEEGIAFDRQGYVANAESAETPPAWKSTLVIADSAVTGYPISPSGVAEHRKVELPLADWQRVLARGDPVLQMHIPAGDRFSLDECAGSMRRAVEFFRRHFPGQAPAAVACRSWMFSPHLEEILPPSSNLVRCLREFYLYPVVPWGVESLWFVFLQEEFSLATAPRDTSLQRGIADWLARGNAWHDGGVFILADDLDRFGTQQYRRSWPPKGMTQVHRRKVTAENP